MPPVAQGAPSVLSVAAWLGLLLVAFTSSAALERLPLQGRHCHWKRGPTIFLARTRLDSGRSVVRSATIAVVSHGRVVKEEVVGVLPVDERRARAVTAAGEDRRLAEC